MEIALIDDKTTKAEHHRSDGQLLLKVFQLRNKYINSFSF